MISTVKVHTIRRFVDRKDHTAYGANTVYDVPRDVAFRWHKEGFGIIIDEALAIQMEMAMESQGLTGLESTQAIPEPTVAKKETPLPDDFPEVNVLIEKGFGTVESLRQKGVEMELGNIDGMTKGKVNKIAIALEKLR